MTDSLPGELPALCEREDVEIFLKHAVTTEHLDYEQRKRHMASNILRQLYANEHKNLDELIATSPLTRQLVRDTVAAVVAIDLKRAESSMHGDGETDLSSFSTFTQSAGGYSFTGQWRGYEEDVFFTDTQLKNLGLKRSTLRRFAL